MSIKAPYLPYSKLREISYSFLAEHNPNDRIPVPIEEIVEFNFELDVISLPGLMRNHDVDSFLSRDLTAIFIDEFIYNHRPSRYRFSLAHEVSHVVIHGDILRELSGFTTIAEWKQSIADIPPDQYRWIEKQAYGLAGLILVPDGHLTDKFHEHVDTASAAGIDLSDASDDARKTIAASISRCFGVSGPVIEKCLAANKMWDTL